MANRTTAPTLKRSFVRDQAYLLLRNWIIDGTLQPEQKLRDKELAEELGVSRTPIREALLRLEDEGYIQTKPNSYTAVSPICTENIFNLYSIIWTLELLAMEQTFTLLNDCTLQKMITLNDQLQQAIAGNDFHAAVSKDEEFHAAYLNMCANEELRTILTTTKQKLKRVELIYFHKVRDLEQSIEEHRRIINALQKRDLPVLLQNIEQNWKRSFTRLQAHLQNI